MLTGLLDMDLGASKIVKISFTIVVHVGNSYTNLWEHCVKR